MPYRTVDKHCSAGRCRSSTSVKQQLYSVWTLTHSMWAWCQQALQSPQLPRAVCQGDTMRQCAAAAAAETVCACSASTMAQSDRRWTRQGPTLNVPHGAEHNKHLTFMGTSKVIRWYVWLQHENNAIWTQHVFTLSFILDLVSSWSENIFVSFCLRAPGYGFILWCALGLLVAGAIQVPQLQLQLLLS